MGKRREEITTVQNNINTHGLDTFDFNEYKEIENQTFHRLRKAYLKAKERLLKYVDNHSKH